MSNEQIFGLAVMALYAAVPVAVIAFIASFHMKKWRGALIAAFVAGAVAVIAFAVGESVERSISRATKLPAEAAVTGQTSVANRFGQNTVSADCARSRSEDATPPPCSIIQIVNPELAQQNTEFSARLVNGVLTVLARRGNDTTQWDYRYATDQHGTGIDIERIAEVRFVHAGVGVTVDWVRVQH